MGSEGAAVVASSAVRTAAGGKVGAGATSGLVFAGALCRPFRACCEGGVYPGFRCAPPWAINWSAASRLVPARCSSGLRGPVLNAPFRARLRFITGASLDSVYELTASED